MLNNCELRKHALQPWRRGSLGETQLGSWLRVAGKKLVTRTPGRNLDDNTIIDAWTQSMIPWGNTYLTLFLDSESGCRVLYRFNQQPEAKRFHTGKPSVDHSPSTSQIKLFVSELYELITVIVAEERVQASESNQAASLVRIYRVLDYQIRFWTSGKA